MATIATQRAAIAAALSTVSSLRVTARPVGNNVKAKDGWVTVGKIQPYDYSCSLATFTAVIVLGSDPVLAETSMETLAVPLVDKITTLDVTDVSVEPQVIAAGDVAASTLFVLALTFTMEVTS